jgi:aspartyl protease family protein
MLRFLFVALSLGVSAITVPKFLTQNQDMVHDAAVIVRDQARIRSVKRAPVEAEPAPLSGTERLHADRRGHYFAEFRLNNTRVSAMIDTGASFVAINETTARRAGLRVQSGDFVYPVQTANGEIKVARAVLDTIRLGSIRVRNVEVMVLDDRSLPGALIGMSFLNRLRSVTQKNGSMELRQ